MRTIFFTFVLVLIMPSFLRVYRSQNVFHGNNSITKSTMSIVGNKRLADLPVFPNLPTMADGRHYPVVPEDSEKIAQQIVFLEKSLRDPSIDRSLLPGFGHQQQVIYRVLSTKTVLADQVLSLLPPEIERVANRHLSARREFLAMKAGQSPPKMMPAWRIINPEPLSRLLAFYRKAEASTGIEWEVLAAVNLVESGMGRIDGVSVSNAMGPMQFLPTTWNEPGIGMGGDIHDPHDSIQAAARYLVRRGGLDDIKKGLWGYNNSNFYVKAVLQYADLLKEDPRSFVGLYHWEIHYKVNEGDLWLPVGYSQNRQKPISSYIKDVPASLPPSTLLMLKSKTSRG